MLAQLQPHLQYLGYVLRHKWHVFWACVLLGVPVWRAVIHDWTKFTPAEWGPYVRRFYGPQGYRPGPESKGYNHDQNKGQDAAFDAAWEHHWRRNPHHPQYWVRGEEDYGYAPWGSEAERVQEMPLTYVQEMVADWIGAGRAQGKPDIMGWYQANKENIVLHPFSRAIAESLLQVLQQHGLIP
jgi:hypothetical protein